MYEIEDILKILDDYLPEYQKKILIDYIKEDEEYIEYWQKEYDKKSIVIDKAIEYINWVFENTNKPTNTIVALRTLEYILEGSEENEE